ncbi:MAG: glycosyltransferase family 4 protein [Lactovum sp.]
MRIGIFSDTYFPQISGVSTSIKTLRDELEALGHTVYIFTTTDPNSNPIQDIEEKIIRLRSIPFISIPERRIVMAGFSTALKLTKSYQLDIIHTQTEFGVGILGKIIANQLKLPMVHTLHTKYEDYLHYIANGLLIRPSAIKYLIKTFLLGTEGIICPSEMTKETVLNYGINIPLRVIPTGINIKNFIREDISELDNQKLRKKLSVKENDIMLLSLCRLSSEKNIQAIIYALPDIILELSVRLIIVGEGPYRKELEKLVQNLQLESYIEFVGEVPNQQVVNYYKAADFFISASTSETQGLTFIEALAASCPILAWENPYLKTLITDPSFGSLFYQENEIAETTLKAIKQQQEINHKALEEKLYEISSENFGKTVADFYQYMIDHYIPFSKRTSLKAKQKSKSLLENIYLQTQKIQRRQKLFRKKPGKYVKINKDDK